MPSIVYPFPHRTTLEVSLSAIVKNAVTLRVLCQKELMPVVKDNAYGHGLVPVSRALYHQAGCLTFCVSNLEEGITLRKALPQNAKILVLSGFLPHQIEAYVAFHLTPVIHHLPYLKLFQSLRHRPDFHLKLDTGMSRLGITPQEFPEAISCLEKGGIKLSGLLTHLAESETLSSAFTDQQIKVFESQYEELHHRKLLQTDAQIHLANSAAILCRRTGRITNSARPGIALYGVSPNPLLLESDKLYPAIQWKTRVLSYKEIQRGDTVGYNRLYKANKKERIGFLPVGYGDGYPRIAASAGYALASGEKLPIRGAISMDLISVGISNLDKIPEGQTITLMGKSYDKEISCWDLAQWSHTIPYEIMTRLSLKIQRVYS